MKAFRVLVLSLILVFSPSVFSEGNEMNFDFASINTSTALQLISDFARLNLVGADDVQGTITMRMKNVTWEQALDYVIRTKNLTYQIDGNVLYVSRDPEYFTVNESPLPAQVELQQKIFTVRHMTATDAIKGFPLTTASGSAAQESISANDAAGVVLARLSPPRLEELTSYLQAVDFARRQVMIEARIIEVDRSFSKELGVNWSGTIRPGNFVGSTAATFVDSSTSPVAAGIGFVSNSLVLDLELAAMEKGGFGKVISQPRVFVSDKQQARILKGSEVPYQQSAGDGATSVAFKEAALSLDVTPFLDDTGVMLNIKLAKDEPDFSNAINGVPPIKTASLSSNVRVKLGSTVALGGVFSTVENTQEHRVPGLAAIPWLGRIFRYSTHSTSTAELVLFITPTLVPSDDLASSGH